MSKLLHIALNYKSCNLRNGIGTYSDGLLETTRKLVCSIISYVNSTIFTWLDGLLGKRRNGAATTGKCLMNNQRSSSCILETETALNDRLLLALFNTSLYILLAKEYFSYE